MEPGQLPAADGLADALGMLRYRWWVVAMAVLLGIAAAAGWLRTQQPVWVSTTSVLVRPAGQDRTLGVLGSWLLPVLSRSLEGQR